MHAGDNYIVGNKNKTTTCNIETGRNGVVLVVWSVTVFM